LRSHKPDANVEAAIRDHRGRAIGPDLRDNAYLVFNGFDNYWYWNAGLVLAVEKITFDFRYWGSDASNAVSDTLSCINHYCDGRFIFYRESRTALTRQVTTQLDDEWRSGPSNRLRLRSGGSSLTIDSQRRCAAATGSQRRAAQAELVLVWPADLRPFVPKPCLRLRVSWRVLAETRGIVSIMNAFKLACLYGAAGVALVALAGAAAADGYEQYSPPPPPADEGRKFTYSFNIAGTSDYVFRGVSQTDNDPTIQGGFDLTYGILYAGAWGSGLDFGGPPSLGFGLDAKTEIDWYGGIRPTWNSPLGVVNLDFGVIYYTYPGADDPLAELNYLEFKAGYSWSALHPQLTTGTAVFYSSDYFGETGPVWTIETMAAYALPKVWVFDPVINGVLGWQKGDAIDGYFVNIIGTDDEYYYWNAGLALTVEKITFDFRYWDTNIGGDAGGPICALATLCDERFVFTAKVVVP
jgi:uncharacterized protein (TIGR02001 family)